MNSFTGYLAIGAVLMGMAIGSEAEECGSVQKAEPLALIAVVLAWPAAVPAVFFYDLPTIETTCGESLSPSDSPTVGTLRR